MKSKVMRSLALVCLAAVFVLVSAGTPGGAAGAASVGEASGGDAQVRAAARIENKNEVVYATLNAEGDAGAVYVVNHFELSQGGTVEDHGDYESVRNLTDNGSLVQDGDTISFTADTENFYYQGNMASTDLPWKFEITYTLDGKKVLPQELSGRSGKLEIHIGSTKNSRVDSSFYDGYMLQISVTLDAGICSNIDAPGATIASAGNNKVVAYTIMPGNDADATITADVSDFSMSGPEITGMPFAMSFELPDTDTLLGDLSQLPQAISELNDGVGALLAGASELSGGAAELVKGSSEFQTGLAQLKSSAEQLTGASAEINDALAAISSSLNGASTGNAGLAQLPQGLTRMSDALDEISGGLAALRQGYSSAYGALKAAIQDIPDTTISESEMTGLYAATSPDMHGVLGQLMEFYAAGKTVKGTYSQVKEAFESVGTTIDTLASSIDDIAGSLDTMAGELGASLSAGGTDQLMAGLTELAGNYAAFHTGLSDYMDGVGRLPAGYEQLHLGLASVAGGLKDLRGGIGELHEGTETMSGELAGMPDMVQDEVDKLIEEYVGADYTPVSFASEKNRDTGYVQFVLKCEGIEPLPADDGDAEAEEAGDETVWDRFLALFRT